jgi:iron complex outermembrane recepter protein
MKLQDFIRRSIPALFFLLLIQICNAQNGTVKGKITNGIEPLPSATVSLGDKFNISDANGEFVFSIRPGKYILTVTYIGYQKVEKEITVSAGHQQNIDFVLKQSDEKEDVIVLGSRTRKQRNNLNTPVPTDIIQVSKLPARQVELSRIIENTIPSFTAATHGFREGRQTVPISLRGLGPDRTLVLLNGRRLHNMAAPWTFGFIGLGTVGVDLNAVPSASIETIEVLRDGASAQYGSDAIAGVINLQLRKSTGITSVQLRTGQYYMDDGESISLSVNHGFIFLKKGFLNFTAQTRFSNYTQRNGVYDSTVYYRIPASATTTQRDSIRALDNQRIAERGFSRKNHRPLGDNRVLNTGFSVNGGYSFSMKTSLEWSAIWNYRVCKDISSNVYRYPRDSSTMVNMQLYPDGFLPYMRPKMPDISLTSGINGITSSGWKWDAGVIYGKNSITNEVFNTNNASQYLLGKDAQTSFYTGKQIFSQVTSAVNFSREMFTKWKTIQSLNIALGAEFRIERYIIKEGEEASWQNYSPTSTRQGGAQGQNGFRLENTINKGRQVTGIYAEAETEQNKKILINLATRYEYYSDFGSSLAGKIALRYKFSKHFLWRGSISNGFRAPALQQRYYSLITTIARPGGVLVKTGTFTNESGVAKAFGISNLEAEKSLNLSTGFTSAISKNISITIDAYWIQIKNRIIYSSLIPDTYTEVRKILDSFGFRDVQAVRFYSNAINTRTKGIDIVFRGKWEIHKSILEASLAANFNKSILYGTVQYAKNLPDNDTYRNLLVNREERCRVEDAYPADKIILNVLYSIGKWKLNTNFTRYGRVNQKLNASNLDETFSPKILTSFNINYKLKSWISITAGAENLFDIYPDKLKNKSNTNNGLQIYSPNFAAFGINGGYYFVSTMINLSQRRSAKS